MQWLHPPPRTGGRPARISQKRLKLADPGRDPARNACIREEVAARATAGPRRTPTPPCGGVRQAAGTSAGAVRATSVTSASMIERRNSAVPSSVTVPSSSNRPGVDWM